MLTLTNVIAPVRGFDPDSREAEMEWKREAAIERLTDEVRTWSVAELIERSSKSNRQLLDEIISDVAAHIHSARGY